MSSMNLPQEKKIVDDIVAGLEGALAELGMEEDALSSAGHAKIKFHKLLYLAVKWSGNPVQLSWHLYGPDLGNSAPDVSFVEATPLVELPSPAEPSVHAAPELDPRSPEEYCEFFLSLQVKEFGLQDIVEADLHDFLEAFYDEFAPAQFKNLYLYNVQLQRHLWEDQGDITAEDVDEAYCDNLGEIISNIHRELGKYDELSDAFDPFLDYSILLEDVYMKLSSSSDDEIRGNPGTIVRELNRFYHEYAWKYVSEIISRETAEGSNKHALHSGASEQLQFLDDNYDSFLKDLEETCQKAGLIPDSDDFRLSFDEDSEIRETIQLAGEIYDEVHRR